MHIHHNPLANGYSGAHSAAAAEKAAATARASETRKKLLKSAAAIDGELNPGQPLMIAHWSEKEAGQREQQGQPRRNRKRQETREALVSAPVSFWA